MNEIFEAFATRIKSPLFGYTVFALFIINWKSLIYVIASKETIIERFVYFDSNTSYYSLLVWPLLIAICGAIIYPWINYIFLLACKKPTELRNNIQASSEHVLLVQKQDFEEMRAALLADKERELIERAKRDEQIEEIENEDTKEGVKEEIKKLRKERDELANKPSSNETNLSQLELAKSLKQLADIENQKGELEKAQNYLEKAIEIERSYYNR